MLFQLLRAERIKLKRAPVWLAFLLMPVVPALLGTLNYLNNLEILQSDWYSLWTQHTLFTCYIFLPIMLGVYCAYLMRLENNSHNWNKVLTMPVPRYLVFLAKLVMASLMVLASEVWIGALFIVSGKIAGIGAPVPLGDVAGWVLCGTLGGVVTVCLQLLLSLFLKSFALPVGIALAGGLSGLAALAKGFGHIWPYSLMAYGMNSNAPQKMLESGYAGFILICVAYIAVLTFAGGCVLSRRDI